MEIEFVLGHKVQERAAYFSFVGRVVAAQTQALLIMSECCDRAGRVTAYSVHEATILLRACFLRDAFHLFPE